MLRKKYFFSYSRTDSKFVLKLANELRSVGAKLWLDQLDIVGGQHWDHSIENALNSCEGMIVILSPDSVTSKNVLDEVSFALEKNKFIIPAYYKDCDIPFRLRRLHYVDFITDYDSGFKQLIEALDINLSQHLFSYEKSSINRFKASSEAIDVSTTQRETNKDEPVSSIIFDYKAKLETKDKATEKTKTTLTSPKESFKIFAYWIAMIPLTLFSSSVAGAIVGSLFVKLTGYQEFFFGITIFASSVALVIFSCAVWLQYEEIF